ncbi:uncharacterized protein [Venturia canescens]|uniref:uncharacterized protein n=1 Tax=Venturia canescens TaxID=32260 RepID=UPI001C9C75DA|nr:uncharacterized protein LOC122412496 [Venturia canescens]
MRPRRRHSSSHPQDNIDASCTVQSISSESKKLTGRRRVLIVPKDNIGIACLPTADRLDNIVELTEFETTTDDEVNEQSSVSEQPSSPQSEMVRAKLRSNGLKGGVIEADQSTSSSNESEFVTKPNTIFERRRSCKRPDTIGLLRQDTGHEAAVNKHEDLKTSNHKSREDIGMSNVRRPRNDPTKPRKPILPRDSIGFGCKISYKCAGRLSGARQGNGINYKNSSNGIEKKNAYPARLSEENTRREEKTREQIDTLRTVSKLSVLLLYIHFLLTYYLSFVKSHRYTEIFDSCPSPAPINNNNYH